MKLTNLFTALVFLGLALSVNAQSDQQLASASLTQTAVLQPSTSQVMSDDIIGVAASDKRFATLVAAVKAADLVETLQGDGPFTVFAPTNSAFDKLPKGTIATLLKEENKNKIASILAYHVIPGEWTAAKIIANIESNGGGFMATTVQGQPIYASLVDGKVVLQDANGGSSTITVTDIEATNGVIHAIDTVVLPKE
ncbi:secreted and surface protein containing fasciclin-like repeats [Nonlabens ulvanivorans]|uniref:Secreted and surface protein containing fasciclin-like repeats n=1 Tax=Nonlabens ulvanivorans TaxID=906888 RepID=A0A090QH47_NONUL|nr:fasciclin domain-containing protein [Nonlabens ulvanivorans]GAL01109.1 secreted and surface protein containing fasciclin-like repeats [Nonlabens ulvanivorans]